MFGSSKWGERETRTQASHDCTINPRSVLEAMALGTPVVARRNTGTCTLLAHQATGLLFDDGKGFVDAVVRVLTDNKLRAHLVVRCSVKLLCAVMQALTPFRGHWCVIL